MQISKNEVGNLLWPSWLTIRSSLGHYSVVRIRRTLLSRRSHGQTQMLSRVIINPPWRAQRGIFHVQLLIQFERLRPRSLKLLKLVMKLNAFEMLPGIRQ
jgi:hypothetical protein